MTGGLPHGREIFRRVHIRQPVAAVHALEELDRDLPIVKLAPPWETLDVSGFVREWKEFIASGLPKKSFCWGCA